MWLEIETRLCVNGISGTLWGFQRRAYSEMTTQTEHHPPPTLGFPAEPEQIAIHPPLPIPATLSPGLAHPTQTLCEAVHFPPPTPPNCELCFDVRHVSKKLLECEEITGTLNPVQVETRTFGVNDLFPPPLWGRAREGGIGLPITPTLTLPHQGGGDQNLCFQLERGLDPSVEFRPIS